MGALLCYCSGELPIVYRAARPIARKQHKCYECGVTISAGERYENVFAIYPGDTRGNVFKTCVHCLAVRDLVESRLQCFCWEHGNLHENVCDVLAEASWRYPGLAFAVGRIEAEKWKAVK